MWDTSFLCSPRVKQCVHISFTGGSCYPLEFTLLCCREIFIDKIGLEKVIILEVILFFFFNFSVMEIHFGLSTSLAQSWDL